MPMRWLGAVLVLTASAGGGWMVARRLRRRPQDLRMAQQAVELLRTEIEYGATPLPTALVTVGQRLQGPVQCLLVGAGGLLGQGQGLSAQEAWRRGLAAAEDCSAWTPTDVRVLAQLGEALGATGAEDQIRHMELCMGRLRLAEEEAARVAASQARMWLYLGVLTGLGMVVLGV